MPIQINGTDLAMQPTNHNWVSRDNLGYSGDGHPIYSAVRSYKMIFNLESASDFNQLVTFFNSVSTTGTVVATLPQWAGATYNYVPYSGTVVNEPEFSNYFEEYAEEVTVLLTGIRT